MNKHDDITELDEWVKRHTLYIMKKVESQFHKEDPLTKSNKKFTWLKYEEFQMLFIMSYFFENYMK